MKKRLFLRVLATGVLICGMIGMANASIITNGVLSVGVNDNGTINDKPAGVGITYTGYPGADYTFPGSPFQYYSIGISGNWGANSSDYSSDHDLSATTTGTSADTYGTYENLSFHQNMMLVDEKINFSVTLTNWTDQELNNVV